MLNRISSTSGTTLPLTLGLVQLNKDSSKTPSSRMLTGRTLHLSCLFLRPARLSALQCHPSSPSPFSSFLLVPSPHLESWELPHLIWWGSHRNTTHNGVTTCNNRYIAPLQTEARTFMKTKPINHEPIGLHQILLGLSPGEEIGLAVGGRNGSMRASKATLAARLSKVSGERARRSESRSNAVARALSRASPTAAPLSSPRRFMRSSLRRQGRTLWMDNYYNSPILARLLKINYHTDCIGTLRINRKNVSQRMREKKLKKGEVFGEHSSPISELKWSDKKIVSMISTYHGAEMKTDTKEKKIKMKPISVIDYNKFMGGVDLKDQLLQSYLIERKRNTKWYMEVAEYGSAKFHGDLTGQHRKNS
ncbi:hypothetical protein J437_LFUL018890 [Ladona fulva]|uniref:PiggyBac transposable element-derived protein domain-containing protein n=1 Tax=Ladona fulva TaxID=123851 RepID=A0A8K0KT91_LADFU|nr:hypothetical protein J437_LFUL018890 [Ladona fulva]